nr:MULTISPECIES: NAD(P)H-dependent oxidoreductase [Paenibacillus]
MKTLVILAHPNIEVSKVNQRWKEELLQHSSDITIHEIYKAYPDWNIDVSREQKLLEAFDHIIRMDHQETSCKGKSWAWPCPLVISRKIIRGMVQCPLL